MAFGGGRQTAKQMKLAKYLLSNLRLLRASIVLVVVVLLVGVSSIPGSGQDVSPGASPAWIVGNPAARVEIEVFNDYQCPPCNTFNDKLKKIETKHKDDVKIIFRNFPLPAAHRNALAAAQTAEAAGLQGKFREMVNLLYSERLSWVESKEARKLFLAYARKLNLDIYRFVADVDGERVRERIRLDVDRAKSLAVEGTPTVFLNGKKVRVEDTLDFDSLIEQLLKEADH